MKKNKYIIICISSILIIIMIALCGIISYANKPQTDTVTVNLDSENWTHIGKDSVLIPKKIVVKSDENNKSPIKIRVVNYRGEIVNKQPMFINPGESREIINQLYIFKNGPRKIDAICLDNSGSYTITINQSFK